MKTNDEKSLIIKNKDCKKYTLEELEKLNMVKIYRGKIIPKSNSGIYPVYSSSIQNNGLMGFSNEYMFDDEKITWSIDGGGNFFFRKKHKYSVTNVSGIIDVTSDLINIVFLFYQLYKQQKKYKFDYQLKAYPSVIKKIYKIYLPDITIQNKIASLFLCLDELIILYEEKLLALETYNKGLRQKLFNQSVRFKRSDGSSYPEWEEKRLEDIALFLDEKRKPITSNVRKKGMYPYYGASGIIDYIDEYIFDEELVLLSEDGANIIDRNYPICYIAKGKYWVNNHAHVLKSKAGVNNTFLKESLEKIDYKKYNTGTVQPKLNQETCRNLVINIPCIEEQQKIAEVLSYADELTEQIKNKILLLKITKTSLLNDIFD